MLSIINFIRNLFHKRPIAGPTAVKEFDDDWDSWVVMYIDDDGRERERFIVGHRDDASDVAIELREQGFTVYDVMSENEALPF